MLKRWKSPHFIEKKKLSLRIQKINNLTAAVFNRIFWVNLKKLRIFLVLEICFWLWGKIASLLKVIWPVSFISIKKRRCQHIAI
jgi:hypothetical protein